MRPYMGIVSASTASRSPGRFAFLIEFMPRSDKARLMDLVKLRGVVDGSRRSKTKSKVATHCRYSVIALKRKKTWGKAL